MRVAIPHNLGKDEVRRRLRERGHEIADQVPGGLAQVSTGWDGDDCMTMRVAALGGEINGVVEIGEAQVVVDFDLPPALSFIEPMIGNAIQKSGRKMLEPPKG